MSMKVCCSDRFGKAVPGLIEVCLALLLGLLAGEAIADPAKSSVTMETCSSNVAASVVVMTSTLMPAAPTAPITNRVAQVSTNVNRFREEILRTWPKDRPIPPSAEVLWALPKSNEIPLEPAGVPLKELDHAD